MQDIINFGEFALFSKTISFSLLGLRNLDWRFYFRMLNDTLILHISFGPLYFRVTMKRKKNANTLKQGSFFFLFFFFSTVVAESILESLEKCRRVVVVMTPCLLDSPWATWATYSGIQTALTSRARILALVLKVIFKFTIRMYSNNF